MHMPASISANASIRPSIMRSWDVETCWRVTHAANEVIQWIKSELLKRLILSESEFYKSL